MARKEETVTIWNVDYPPGRNVTWGSGFWITVPPAGEGVTLTGLNVIYKAKRLVESTNTAVNAEGRLSLDPPFDGAPVDEISSLKAELAKQKEQMAVLLNQVQSVTELESESETETEAKVEVETETEAEVEVEDKVEKTKEQAPPRRPRSKKGQ